MATLGLFAPHELKLRPLTILVITVTSLVQLGRPMSGYQITFLRFFKRKASRSKLLFTHPVEYAISG